MSDVNRILRRTGSEAKTLEQRAKREDHLSKRIEHHRKKRDAEEEETARKELLGETHVRHSKKVLASGSRIGSTLDRLKPLIKPAKISNKERKFEGPVKTLVEKYGSHWDEHATLGQLMRCKIMIEGGKMGVKDLNHGDFYPFGGGGQSE